MLGKQAKNHYIKIQEYLKMLDICKASSLRNQFILCYFPTLFKKKTGFRGNGLNVTVAIKYFKFTDLYSIYVCLQVQLILIYYIIIIVSSDLAGDLVFTILWSWMKSL